MRRPSSDKSSGLKKGTWTPEEDSKLIAYVTRYGCWNWRQLPRFAGLARCGKSCRLRWLNYLRPDIRRGNYTHEEDELIIKFHQQLGNRWSAIAAKLPGRTDNEIKNHWHTILKNKCQVQLQDNNTATPTNAKDEIILKPSNHYSESQGIIADTDRPATSFQIPDNGKSSLQSTSTESSDIDITSSTTEQSDSNNENLGVEDDFAFLDAYAEGQPMSGSFWTEPYVGDSDISYDVPTLSLPLGTREPQCSTPTMSNIAQLWSHSNFYDQYSDLF